MNPPLQGLVTAGGLPENTPEAYARLRLGETFPCPWCKREVQVQQSSTLSDCEIWRTVTHAPNRDGVETNGHCPGLAWEVRL